MESIIMYYDKSNNLHVEEMMSQEALILNPQISRVVTDDDGEISQNDTVILAFMPDNGRPGTLPRFLISIEDKDSLDRLISALNKIRALRWGQETLLKTIQN